jgi:hypothetical protein
VLRRKTENRVPRGDVSSEVVLHNNGSFQGHPFLQKVSISVFSGVNAGEFQRGSGCIGNLWV